MSHPGTSCHLSPESVTQQGKHAEHLGCNETVIPCLQLLAVKVLHHARPGLGVFPRQWHRETRGGLSSQCPPAGPAECPQPEVLVEWLCCLFPPEDLRPHTSCFLLWDHRVGGVCVTFHLLGELLNVSWAVLVWSCFWCDGLFYSVLLRKAGTVMLKRAVCCFTLINNANIAHTQSTCGCVWSCWFFCRFVKLLSCSYSSFDFRSFQCRLFTNWTWKRTITD